MQPVVTCLQGPLRPHSLGRTASLLYQRSFQASVPRVAVATLRGKKAERPPSSPAGRVCPEAGSGRAIRAISHSAGKTNRLGFSSRPIRF